jgi:radical SAM protein with 4Fe4S-binding SPASM domain
MILKKLLDKASQLSQEEKKLIQLQLLNSTPFFDIELSSKCNVSCIMCPRIKLRRKQELMSKDTINKLIDWLPNNSKAMISGLGEPLLNDYIFLLAKGLNKKGIEVGLTTNGVLLTRATINNLIHCNVNFIQISFNGASEKVYNSIMQGADFSAVIDNLKYLAKIKKDHMTVKLAVTAQSSNKDDIANIRAFADNLGFEIFLRNLHSRAGAICDAIKQIDFSCGCGIFSKVTFIAANGEMLSCCQDMQGKFVLGNIFNHSFDKIMIKKKKIVEKNTWFPICKNCDDEYRYHLFFDNTIKEK